MPRIKKVYPEDFDLIYPLLLGYNNQRITKEDWRQLFVNHWDNDEQYLGLALVDQDEYIGFIGLLFSKRIIDDKEYKFCNINNWIVKEQYRSQSLLQLLHVLKLKDYTFTNLTPIPEIIPIFKKLGFRETKETSKSSFFAFV